ncbi:EfeM/EfeO family lipoprotein [Glutamicibacter halophytocola]|uniref:EfeM/EfeO family lipoprotein n=1 Tax=Glutamicibacter halophytocola TaxID=1933880 RepID=UPI00321BB30C
MVENTQKLYDRTLKLSFTPDQLANGAKSLLDEVATGKVTGEEETFSHTDLWDFQANMEGAKIAYQDLKPLLEGTDDKLDAQLEKNFTSLQGQPGSVPRRRRFQVLRRAEHQAGAGTGGRR